MKTLLIIFGVILVIAGALSEDKNYFFSYPLKTNWFKAVEACKFKNMELVSVLTPDTLNDVQSYIDDLKLNNWFDEWTNSIWTSGNDLGEQGQYTCVSTGKHISGQMLLNENINNQNHGDCMIEHCLALVRKSANQFIFNDDLCSSQRYFICEDRVIPDCSQERILPELEHVPENELLLTDNTLTTEEPTKIIEEESDSDEYSDGSEEQNVPAWWPYKNMDRDSQAYTR